jgi:hypothetical protein
MSYGIPSRELPTFAHGFMQGYGFVNGLQQQARQNKRQDEQDAWRKKKQAHQEQQWANNAADRKYHLGLRDQKQAALDAQREHRHAVWDREDAKFAHQKTAWAQAHKADAQAKMLPLLSASIYAHHNGDDTAAAHYYNEAAQYSDKMPATYDEFMSPEYQQAIDTGVGALNGDVRLSPPQVGQTAATLFPRVWNKGAGEQTDDGLTITSKRPIRFYPSPDGQRLFPDLRIDGTYPDGTPGSYTAPMTAGRSANANDNVVSGPKGADTVDALVGLHRLQAAYLAAGGKPYWRAKAGTGGSDKLPQTLSQQFKAAHQTIYGYHKRKNKQGFQYMPEEVKPVAARQDARADRIIQRLRRHGVNIPGHVVGKALVNIPAPMTTTEAQMKAEKAASKREGGWGHAAHFGTDANGRPLTEKQFIQKETKRLLKQSRAAHKRALKQMEKRLLREYGGHRTRGGHGVKPAKTARAGKAKVKGFDSAEAVRKAYNAGKLSRDKAEKILKQQFGMSS